MTSSRVGKVEALTWCGIALMAAIKLLRRSGFVLEVDCGGKILEVEGVCSSDMPQ